MKKIYLIFIFIMLLGFLTACKSEDTKLVESKINGIGEITKESSVQLEIVRNAYEELDEKDKLGVSNYDKLKEKEDIYNEIIAQNVIELIDDIGTINDESKNKIENIRTRFDKLKKEQKKKVDNLGEFLKKEKEYNEYIVNRAVELLNGLSFTKYDDYESLVVTEGLVSKLSEEQRKQVENKVNKNIYETLEITKINIINFLIDDISYKKGEPNIDELKHIIKVINIINNIDEKYYDKLKTLKPLKQAMKSYLNYKKDRNKKDKLYIRDNYLRESSKLNIDDLKLYPDSYIGKKINMEIEVVEKNKGILLFDDTLIVKLVETNEVVKVIDDRKIKEPVISLGDSFSVYGKYSGMTKTKEAGEIPKVSMVYTSNDNLGLIANGDPDATDIGLNEKAEELKRQLDELIVEIDKKIN